MCDFRVFACEVFSELINACLRPLEDAAIGAHNSVCMLNYKVSLEFLPPCETGIADVA